MLSYIQNKKNQKLEDKIQKLKQSIAELESLRPGSVTQQIAGGPGRKPRKYWQISYTYKMRSRADYLRDELVEVVEKETLEYKKLLMKLLIYRSNYRKKKHFAESNLLNLNI